MEHARSARPAVMVAGTHSGAGKTTVTAALLRALRERGLRVQSFKLGPDFIDPAYHREVTGRPCVNLDLWLMGASGVRRAYREWSADADIAVIEAMGALFDGADGSGRGSAAHLARLLGVPVVVVLDVYGMTRTTGAVMEGMRTFDPALEPTGYILNRVGSATHARMVTDALPTTLRRRVLGTVLSRPELSVPERHLGLVTVEENATSATDRDRALTTAGEGLDVDRLLRVAGAARTEPVSLPQRRRDARPPRVRMAIARDEAFCFYYEDNLRLLRAAGIDLVPFRPTVDSGLPEDVAGVYLGGGYPESFAAQLAANQTLADELRTRAAAGMPMYAECGGLLYLARSLTGFDGLRHAMAGVLPIDVVMDPEHLAIRYVRLRTAHDSPLGTAGTTARGQEFHQSRIIAADVTPNLYQVTSSSGASSVDGYLHHGVVASYVHLHFASNPRLPGALARAAERWASTRPRRGP